MRRTEIINAIENLRNALTQSGIITSLQAVASRRGRERANADAGRGIVSSMRSYFLFAEGFGEAEKKLVQELGLELLNEPEFWEAMLGASDEPTEHVRVVFASVRFAIDHLPVFSTLLQRDSFALTMDSKDGGEATIPEKGLLSVLVIEEHNVFSKPRRLSLLLDSISDLYEACAEVNGMPGQDLMVVSCDSGSDKSFDFMGAAKIVECVKDVILDGWDKVVFYRERKLASRLELVAQGLPIIERIGDLEKEQKLGREQAEILRRKVTQGLGKFLEAGATIPEMVTVSTQNPRALLAPEPKQLVASSGMGITYGTTVEKPAGDDPDGPSAINLDGLTDDERSTLLGILQKVRTNGAPGVPASTVVGNEDVAADSAEEAYEQEYIVGEPMAADPPGRVGVDSAPGDSSVNGENIENK